MLASYAQEKERERARDLLAGYGDILRAADSANEPMETASDAVKNIKWKTLSVAIRYSGLNKKALLKRLAKIGLISGSILVIALVKNQVGLVLGIPVVVFLDFQGLRSLAQKRAHAFEKDYTALLLSLASAIKTGLDPLSALVSSQKLFDEKSELKKELKLIERKIELGMPEDKIIRSFAETIEHPDIDLFRSAFILARKQGSSLAVCLQRLTKVTRQRQSFRRKIKSAVAMQKMSAYAIGACTLGISVMQAISNPANLKATWVDPLGSMLIIFGVSMSVLGLIWMLYMARSRT